MRQKKLPSSQSADPAGGLGAGPGTYLLLMPCAVPARCRVGALGELALVPGWYLYVGSAFGPGGVAARCGHHSRLSARPRWHVDYLRRLLPLDSIWYTHDPLHREHEWAGLLAGLRGVSAPMPGFGASDCDCETHLFHAARAPSFEGFRRRLRERLPGHAPLRRERIEPG